MNTEDALEKILKSYEAYYNVNRDTPEAPFDAEAVFHSHDTQYFLVKSAAIGEAESNEYVFFARRGKLGREELKSLDEAAWRIGTSRVKPHSNHRNTDVTLVIICDQADAETMKEAAKLKHYESYRCGLQGWSHYSLIVQELSSGRTSFNRQGRTRKKLFDNIFQ